MTLFIVYRKGKNAIQLFRAGKSKLDIAFQQNFGIASCFKSMPKGFQLGAQLFAVIQLPVVNDGVVKTVRHSGHEQYYNGSNN